MLSCEASKASNQIDRCLGQPDLEHEHNFFLRNWSTSITDACAGSSLILELLIMLSIEIANIKHVATSCDSYDSSKTIAVGVMHKVLVFLRHLPRFPGQSFRGRICSARQDQTNKNIIKP
jgi:hypothetical protein